MLDFILETAHEYARICIGTSIYMRYVPGQGEAIRYSGYNESLQNPSHCDYLQVAAIRASG
jgi:hypothetical protein